MPIDPHDLLAVADSLASTGGEPHDRSVISRAYYAAFHHAREWHRRLSDQGHDIGPQGGEHQRLINRLKNPGARVGSLVARNSRLFGAKLQALRDRRVKADYDLQAVIPRTVCGSQLSQAKDALQKYPWAGEGAGPALGTRPRDPFPPAD